MRKVLFACCILLSACSSNSPNQTQVVNQQEAAKTRISLGLTYLKNGNYTQAKFNLDKALQFAPKLADVHYSLAYYYQTVAEQALAEQSYQRAMELDPNNGDIVNSYGVYLCQQGKYPQAKAHFLKALSQSQYLNTAETYENLALCAKQQGRFEEAAEYARSAVQHQPSRGKSLLLLTELYIDLNRWAEAQQSLRQYDKVAKVTPLSLWLWFLIEEGMGKPELAKGYGNMLLQLFPNHQLSQLYLQRRPLEPTKLTKPAVEENSESEGTSEPEDTSEKEFHLVQKGENLYRISLKYNVKMKRLIEWNNLPNASAIQVGKPLRIVAPN